MQRARALDSQASAGLLHGLPIAVKDVFDTFDMPTCYGSPIYAEPLSRGGCGIRCAGARRGRHRRRQDGHDGVRDIPSGADVQSPQPEAHPGGSSSGSAAAVADGMVPLAFGTQTAGSIVRPAAFCGVVGYKPTYGTINRVGVKLVSDTLDTVGVLARTVPDVALFVAALSDRRELLIERPQAGPPRVGLCRTHEWDRAAPGNESGVRGCGSASEGRRGQCSRHHAAAAVRGARRCAVHGHGARGRAILGARVALAPRRLERQVGRHDQSRSCGIGEALRRGAGVGSAEPRGARGVFSRTSTSCIAPSAAGEAPEAYGRPVTRCSTGCGRCCVRPASICRWESGRADCRSGVTIAGADRSGSIHAAGRGLDPHEARLACCRIELSKGDRTGTRPPQSGAIPFSVSSLIAASFFDRCESPMPRNTCGALVN